MIPLEVKTGVEAGLYFKRWYFDGFSIVCWNSTPIKGDCIDKEAEKWADTIDPDNIPTYGYMTKCQKNT